MDGAVTVEQPFQTAGQSPAPAKRRNEFWRFSRRHAGCVRNGVNSKLPGALFGDADPFRPLKKETPVQRLMMTMALQGYDEKEIAQAVGRDKQVVRNALRQPHARTRMIEEARKDVSVEIKAFLEAEVLPSLRVMQELRDDKNVSAAVRLQAAEKLAERTLGKPTQPFEVRQQAKPVSTMTDAELDQAIGGLPAPAPEVEQLPS